MHSSRPVHLLHFVWVIIHSHRHPCNRRFLIKVSILLFYQRIFGIKSAFRKATWIVSGLIFGFFVELKEWNPHTYIQYKAFWVSFSYIGLALDIVVLVLPQPLGNGFVPLATWSAVERETRIICACLPIMPTPFTQLFHRKNRGGSNTAGHKNSDRSTPLDSQDLARKLFESELELSYLEIQHIEQIVLKRESMMDRRK